MDYFEGITNEEFRQYYLKDLHCISEINYLVYPNEDLEPDSATLEHITKCQTILKEYVGNFVMNNCEMEKTSAERDEIFFSKMRELYPLIVDETDDFCLKVKVNYTYIE